MLTAQITTSGKAVMTSTGKMVMSTNGTDPCCCGCDCGPFVFATSNGLYSVAITGIAIPAGCSVVPGGSVSFQDWTGFLDGVPASGSFSLVGNVLSVSAPLSNPRGGATDGCNLWAGGVVGAYTGSGPFTLIPMQFWTDGACSTRPTQTFDWSNLVTIELSREFVGGVAGWRVQAWLDFFKGGTLLAIVRVFNGWKSASTCDTGATIDDDGTSFGTGGTAVVAKL